MMNKKGFTLIEIIVSVCLLAVLMALTVPGLMNYFEDIDQDRYVAETRSIVAQVKSSYSQLSLSGNYGSTTLPEDVENNIVKDANGSGDIEFVTFKDEKLFSLSYIIEGKTVFYLNENDKESYTVQDKSE